MKGENMKENKPWWVIILAVLLIAAITYIVVDKSSDSKTERESKIYQQGVQVGYQQTIIQIANAAATCQQVPLVIGNTSMNMIWVDCLRTS